MLDRDYGKVCMRRYRKCMQSYRIFVGPVVIHNDEYSFWQYYTDMRPIFSMYTGFGLYVYTFFCCCSLFA